MMSRDSFQGWLDRYVEAWRTYDPERIGGLFSDDAQYLYSPFQDPLRGRDAIVTNWLENKDAPGSWRAQYAPLAIEGNVGVATGRTEYVRHGAVWREFANVYICEFDGAGRCKRFTEWYMEKPAEKPAETS